MDIPTAEEFVRKWQDKALEQLSNPNEGYNGVNLLAEYFKEFAKLHVEAAGLALSSKLITMGASFRSIEKVFENTYPESNIK